MTKQSIAGDKAKHCRRQSKALLRLWHSHIRPFPAKFLFLCPILPLNDEFSAKSFCNIQVNCIFVYNFDVVMTDEEKELLRTFEARLRHLVYLHDELRRENADLRQLLNESQAAREQAEADHRDLEKRYTDLKTATTISLNGSDVKETKLRLSKLVREVDKCIALLNE